MYHTPHKYQIGQLVFLITDQEQKERIITAICIRENNSISYLLSNADNDSWHYQSEMSINKDILKTI